MKTLFRILCCTTLAIGVFVILIGMYSIVGYSAVRNQPDIDAATAAAAASATQSGILAVVEGVLDLLVAVFGLRGLKGSKKLLTAGLALAVFSLACAVEALTRSGVTIGSIIAPLLAIGYVVSGWCVRRTLRRH